MSDDAIFEEGAESPLRLQALDAEDLKIISALVQDAILPASEMRYERKRRSFAMLINRFRWEEQRSRTAERVRSLMLIDDVLAVASQGVPRGDPDLVLSVLALEFEPGEDGTGAVSIILAGDGEIRIEVECLSVMLRDVTRPYRAISGQSPRHDT
ncbi:MAG: DUF2948 family protein [Rhodobacteraceae bacterium]|nr:MAG: DUF2948 family protein [Paracoccaceae bacterium]